MSSKSSINVETRNFGNVTTKLPRLLENYFQYDTSFRNATATTRIKKINIITI